MLRRSFAGSQVVLKVFDLADASQRRELTRQVKLVSRLDHPHVAKLQGLFFHKASNKDEAYLESAYYPNGTLGRYLARADVAAPRLPAPHAAVLDRASDRGAAGALACLQQLLAGLAAVHALPAVPPLPPADKIPLREVGEEGNPVETATLNTRESKDRSGSLS